MRTTSPSHLDMFVCQWSFKR